MINKQHYIALIFSFLTTWGQAQTYSIPDAGFKQCLIDNYNHLLDANDDLDIMAANNQTGILYCAGHGISDVDGLQYFTSIDTINFNQNNLRDINEAGTLTRLKSIIIHNNEITALPDLNAFDQLTELVAHDNFISTPPTLPAPSSLVYINFDQNNLNTFPDITQQTNLEILRISRNSDIKTIPPLPPLPNLKELKCYICGLTEVPDISNLTALEFLDVGYNSITSLPDFSTNTQLNTIYANNNLISSFEPMTVLPSLVKVRLYNNLLSFEDFEHLTAIPDYEDIYKIIPQWELPNPLAAHYFEYDSMSFVTNFAQEASQKTYSWYKNNSLLWQGTLDTFYVDSAHIGDGGSYYYTITHPDFPDLTLSSMTTETIVEECLNPTAFSIDITGATCDKAGIIEVSPGHQPQYEITYILKSMATAREFKNETGIFPHLNNPRYTLYAQAGKRCTKVIDSSLSIPIEECEEAFFTPNGDGIDDSFYFQEMGKVVIYDKWGQKIKELTTPAVWDGSTNNGALVQPGYYTVEINDGEKTIHLSVVY